MPVTIIRLKRRGVSTMLNDVEKEMLENKIKEQADENRVLKAQLQAQIDRSDFIEECIAEMATQVYV